MDDQPRPEAPQDAIATSDSELDSNVTEPQMQPERERRAAASRVPIPADIATQETVIRAEDPGMPAEDAGNRAKDVEAGGGDAKAGAEADAVAEVEEPHAAGADVADAESRVADAVAGSAEAPEPADLDERGDAETASTVDRAALAAGAAPLVEALLFASDTPVSAGKLADVIDRDGVTPAVIRAAIDGLNEKYERCELTFRIEEIARGYQLLSLPDYHEVVSRLHHRTAETRLSDAALETLSIIAYKQPVIRADIESIRGVSSGEMVNRLRDLGLVRILGRADVVGRPLLYGTTRKFLEVFGLADLDDLPPMESLKLRPAADQSPAAEQPVEHRAVAGA